MDTRIHKFETAESKQESIMPVMDIYRQINTVESKPTPKKPIIIYFELNQILISEHSNRFTGEDNGFSWVSLIEELKNQMKNRTLKFGIIGDGTERSEKQFKLFLQSKNLPKYFVREFIHHIKCEAIKTKPGSKLESIKSDCALLQRKRGVEPLILLIGGNEESSFYQEARNKGIQTYCPAIFSYSDKRPIPSPSDKMAAAQNTFIIKHCPLNIYDIITELDAQNDVEEERELAVAPTSGKKHVALIFDIEVLHKIKPDLWTKTIKKFKKEFEMHYIIHFTLIAPYKREDIKKTIGDIFNDFDAVAEDFVNRDFAITLDEIQRWGEEEHKVTIPTSNIFYVNGDRKKQNPATLFQNAHRLGYHSIVVDTTLYAAFLAVGGIIKSQLVREQSHAVNEAEVTKDEASPSRRMSQ